MNLAWVGMGNPVWIFTRERCFDHDFLRDTRLCPSKNPSSGERKVCIPEVQSYSMPDQTQTPQKSLSLSLPRAVRFSGGFVLGSALLMKVRTDWVA